METPKIGAWLCNCKGLISDNINMNFLEKEVLKLKNVTCVKHVNMLCNKNGINELIKDLSSSDVDRFLFAGCSARSSLRFPEQHIHVALNQANIDLGLYEVANIREQCAWLHASGDDLNQKALDMIKMAHTRLIYDVARDPEVKIIDKALVVGGGSASLAAAKELAQFGKEVTLVEEGTYLGGRLCQIPFLFQSEQWHSRCVSLCVGPVQGNEAVFNPLISAYTQSNVDKIEKQNGNFKATISISASFVDPEICISCGKCAEACPEFAPSKFNEGIFVRKAIDKDFERALPDTYSIIEDSCTKCGECVKVCPEDAINLDAKPQEISDSFGAVFLGTGFDLYDTQKNPELGFGIQDVVSSMAFERLIDNGIKRPSNGEEPEHIVFVLCAGSRASLDKERNGVPYCSKTCCGITMRQAERIAQTMEMTEITIIYYYDIRTYERYFEGMFDTIKRMGIEFVKGNIDSIEKSEDGNLSINLSQLDDQTSSLQGDHEYESGKLNINADMVVLASAQVPKKDKNNIAKQLQMKTEINGFPMENQPRIFRPTESFVDRVYVIGSASGPKVVQQAVEQGKAAAVSALPYLINEKKELPKFFSRIDPETCISCRSCETVCPHGAIRITENGVYSDPAFCQSCGFCAAACPTHAAKLVNFTDQQILDQVKVAFDGINPGEPKIMALLCYWCSYSAADLAGVNRIQAPPNFRTIRIRCSSSVNTALLLEMYRMGVDGILIGGCPPKSCHHVHGNYLTDKRMTLFGKLLSQLGLSTKRLRFDYIGVSQYQLFVDTIIEMDKNLRELGPNPAALKN